MSDARVYLNDLLGNEVDTEKVITLLKTISKTPYEQADPPIIYIYGAGGNGKTTFLQMLDVLCNLNSIKHKWIKDFGEADNEADVFLMDDVKLTKKNVSDMKTFVAPGKTLFISGYEPIDELMADNDAFKRRVLQLPFQRWYDSSVEYTDTDIVYLAAKVKLILYLEEKQAERLARFRARNSLPG